MRKTLTEVGVTMFWIAFAFLYVGGCYHSQKKHKDDDTDMLRYSPYSVYRGLEWLFWHDDFKGVDWGNKQKEDAFILFQMMTTPLGGEVPEKVNADIESFKKRIKTYPEKIFNYLDTAGNTYYNYIIRVRNEVNVYLDSLETGNYQFNDNGWNDESTKLENEIVDKYGIVELKGSSLQMDSAFMAIRTEASFGDTKEIDNNRKNLKEKTNLAIAWMKRVYKQIFEKELKD